MTMSEDFKEIEAELREYDYPIAAGADAIATLRAERDAARAVTEWRDIATAPEKPMMVVYCSKWSPRSQEIPDQAFELGYWDGSSWYYLALGHEKFERFDDADDDRPTHYMPLPPAPAIP
jgi:hypothetical protein